MQQTRTASLAPRPRVRLTYAALYGSIAVVFWLATGTHIGPYSARFGPYYLALLLALLAFSALLQPIRLMQAALRPAFAFGAFCFCVVWLVALLTWELQQYGLAIAMFGNLVIFSLSAVLATQITGTRALSFAVLAALVAAASINAYEFLMGGNIWSTAPGRAAGFFENPNNSGMLIVGMLGLWLALRANPALLPALVVSSLALAGVIVTFSRSAFICFVIVLMAVYGQRAWFGGRQKKTTILMLGAVAAVGTLLLSWVLDQMLSTDAFQRIESLRSRQFDDASSLGRYYAFLEFANRFLDSPLLGAGAFGSLIELRGGGPHNTFVAVAADFGIGGLLCYVAILAIGLKSASRMGRQNPIAQMQVVVVTWLAVTSMFSHNVFYSPDGALMIGVLLGSVARRSPTALGPKGRLDG